jgi:hypothetical protein
MAASKPTTSTSELKGSVFDLPVHPAAAIFPMLAEDELDELAADIDTNGLREPLVLADIDGEPMLVDGRNRREACRRAKIAAPAVRWLNGEDPKAFVISANIHRRHMTKGARAMAEAMLHPEPEKGGRGQKTVQPLDSFSKQSLSQARTVLRLRPGLAAEVLAGNMTLDAAYAEATKEIRAKEQKEASARKLAVKAPDLAARVRDEELTLDEAQTLLAKREEEARNVRQSVYMRLRDVRSVAAFAKGEEHRKLPEWLADEDYAQEFRQVFPGGVKQLREHAADLMDGAQEVLHLLDLLEKRKK